MVLYFEQEGRVFCFQIFVQGLQNSTSKVIATPVTSNRLFDKVVAVRRGKILDQVSKRVKGGQTNTQKMVVGDSFSVQCWIVSELG